MASYVVSGYTAPEGVSSRNQVRSIQSQLGVKADGIWGPKTQAAYDSYNTQRQSQADMLSRLYGAASGGVDTSGYDAAISNYNQAAQAAYSSVKADNLARAQKLKDQYNALRSQAYVNRRLGAIGNNELLAAMGLSGNIYGDSASGATETSRISQNIGMRNDVNAITLAEQAERDNLAQALLQARYDSEMNAAQMAAQVNAQRASAMASASGQRFQNLMALAQMEQSMGQGGLVIPAPTSSGKSKKTSTGGKSADQGYRYGNYGWLNNQGYNNTSDLYPWK